MAEGIIDAFSLHSRTWFRFATTTRSPRGLPGVPGQTVPSSVLGTYLWLLFSHLRGKGGAVAAAAVGQVGTGLV